MDGDDRSAIIIKKDDTRSSRAHFCSRCRYTYRYRCRDADTDGDTDTGADTDTDTDTDTSKQESNVDSYTGSFTRDA